MARKAAASALLTLSLGALLGFWLWRSQSLAGLSPRDVLFGALIAVPSLVAGAAFMAERLIGARLSYLAAVIDSTGPNAELARIRDLGADEVGAVALAVNRLMARLTSLRANMIDQQRELQNAQRALKLQADLAEKTEQLSRRLEERAMLFEILRMTSSSPELHIVLQTLLERVNHLLRAREAVLFLYDQASEELRVEGAVGFREAAKLKGKRLGLGEGIAGNVGRAGEALLVDDVSMIPEFDGFWGQAERRGSLAAVPIQAQDMLLGVLCVTRGALEPLDQVQLRLLCAIADNAALAIRNAQLFERMRQLSTHDELTSLANRRLLHTELEREIDRARRFQKPLSLLAIDVDHFKHLNDRHGHPRGDAALREVAALLVANVRKVDTVARVGGEEFTLLLPRTRLDDARAVAEKLRAAVLQHPFSGAADQPGGALTISVGVAELRKDDDERGDSLIARADRALYEAKHAGRNRVCSAA